jgi:hypothetical protein
MSYDILYAKHIKSVLDINNKPYPPSPFSGNSIPNNDVAVGTGSSTPFLKDSGLTVFTTGSAVGITPTSNVTTDISIVNHAKTAGFNTTGTFTNLYTGGSSGTANQVLTATGSNSCIWQDAGAGSSIYPVSTTIPVTAFSYYQKWQDDAVEWWFQTASLNDGTPIDGTNGQDMGTVNIVLAAGTWRTTVTMYGNNATGGIARFIFNGINTDIDTSLGTQSVCYSWDTNIAANGTYTFQLINNGSNSGGFNIAFNKGAIELFKIG